MSREKMVHIVATADLHGILPEIAPCDILLSGGDICPDVAPLLQVKWLDQPFRKWLENVPAKEIIGIAGNHDKIFEHGPHLIPLVFDIEVWK